MKFFKRFIALWILLLIALPTVPAGAEALFGDRRIYLADLRYQTFSAGMTGTTAGYNYIALVEGARQESISLGRLGYWEKVPDPPSFLRNYDLRFVIENRQDGRFKLAFAYDARRQDIDLQVSEGKVAVAVDRSGYFPIVIVRGNSSPKIPAVAERRRMSGRKIVFFDFNSFDSELRRYYGRIKELLRDPRAVPCFYYYEAANYDRYYFRTYDDTGRLDAQKMGLSLENGNLEYYQGVLDNLKSRYGDDFAAEIVLVTRHGKSHAASLAQYARDIGMSNEMTVRFLSYEELP